MTGRLSMQEKLLIAAGFFFVRAEYNITFVWFNDKNVVTLSDNEPAQHF